MINLIDTTLKDVNKNNWHAKLNILLKKFLDVIDLPGLDNFDNLLTIVKDSTQLFSALLNIAQMKAAL